MQLLTEEQERVFQRYRRCSAAVDGFVLLRASACASNKLLDALDVSFAGQLLKTDDYRFLQLLAEKRQRNYRKLTDVEATINLFTILRDAAFRAANIEDK